MKDQGSRDADPNGNDSAPQPVRENAKREDRQASQQGDFHQVECHRPDMRSARPVFHPGCSPCSTLRNAELAHRSNYWNVLSGWTVRRMAISVEPSNISRT
jgi:hypothetical protein